MNRTRRIAHVLPFAIPLAMNLVLLPGLAAAQASNVTLYGKLNVDLESLSNGDTRKQRVSSNSSLFGLRGEEALGGGLSAFFQIESSVGVDTGSGTLAGRSSAVGLKGSAGRLLMGQWDTPYKNVTLRLDPFTNKTFAAYAAVLYGNNSATAANAVNRQSFDRRQKNVLQYWTPEFQNGLKARFAYGVGEEKGTCAVACSPSMWSAAASYDSGPLALMAAYERHDEYANTATVTTRDSAVKLGAQYRWGDTAINAVAEQLDYRGNLAATGLTRTFAPGAAPGVTVHNYWGAVTHRIGVHQWRAAYGRSADLSLHAPGGTATDTAMRYWALGYGYTASKRTELYVMYARIDNAANAASDFGINGVGGVGNGNHPTGFGMGITHSF